MPDIPLSMNHEARFDALYRTYADRVHAYARRRSDAATADDVVSEVFLVAWRRLDVISPEPFGWLIAVARRVLANRRRTDGRTARLIERLSLATPAFAPEAVADSTVRDALGTLSAHDRELLLLTAWEGLRPAEVAEALGVRPGTIAVRLHRARERLAQALAAQDSEVPTPMEVKR
jgi:RNA polymerase sigma-70 factor (ECF subfamily)